MEREVVGPVLEVFTWKFTSNSPPALAVSSWIESSRYGLKGDRSSLPKMSQEE